MSSLCRLQVKLRNEKRLPTRTELEVFVADTVLSVVIGGISAGALTHDVDAPPYPFLLGASPITIFNQLMRLTRLKSFLMLYLKHHADEADSSLMNTKQNAAVEETSPPETTPSLDG